MPKHRGVLRPVRPRGQEIRFQVNPTTVFASRQPLWNRISRPKRSTAITYGGMGEETLVFEVIFDALDGNGTVEERVRRLDALRVPSGERNPPPICKLYYGHMGGGKDWVVDQISESDEQRDSRLHRIYYQAELTLVEHIQADLEISHAKHHRSRHSGGRGRSHRVRHGETLSSIAASDLGDASRWKEIAQLNDIRDPRSLKVGDVLRMPG